MSEAKGILRSKLLESAPEIRWFHRYPARFPRDALIEIMATVCDKLGTLPNLMLDPFSGTGSTLAVARQLGIPSIGMELTQLGVLIAQVRLDPPDDLESALVVAEELALLQPIRKDLPFPDELVGWIGIENASVLAQYLERVNDIKENKLKSWMQLAISSALRPSSRWLAGSIKPQTDPTRIPPPIGPNLIRAARALRRDCDAESRKSNVHIPAHVVKGDARRLPLATGTVDAVVTSPPYATMYDYFDVHRLSYLAFGWRREWHLQIGQATRVSMDGTGFVPPPSMIEWYREYRGEVTAEGRSLRAYINSMRTHFAEIARVLRPRGIVAYAVANSIRRGRTFRLVDALMELISEFDFDEVHAEPRMNSTRRILPAGRDPKTGRFSSGTNPAVDEQVIYALRKPKIR